MTERAAGDAAKIVTVVYRQIEPGVWQTAYQCPPHKWYYANLIMHFRCEFCGALRHTEPKTAVEFQIVREGEVHG